MTQVGATGCTGVTGGSRNYSRRQRLNFWWFRWRYRDADKLSEYGLVYCLYWHVSRWRFRIR